MFGAVVTTSTGKLATMSNRVKTGIAGIDTMLDGGIPQGNQVVIAGAPGTGKTLFAFEYIYKGAKLGEPGIFFSFNQDTESFLRTVKDTLTGFTDIDLLIEDKKLVILGYEETKTFIQKGSESTNYAFTGMISQLQSRIEDCQATRMAIDSLSYIKMYTKDPFEYRNLLTSLLIILGRQHVTSLITAEAGQEADGIHQEFFIYDGVISMGSVHGSGNRVLSIRKMRGANHAHGIAQYRITPNGINVTTPQTQQ
ncbi:MAG: hypothetical protein M1321_02545 [Candidatus Marsarchaeota archaeon]|jgi:circadian clock protein KaiC|nr:hypothetical protein [Candidatus Marsarchaeota archaeon]